MPAPYTHVRVEPFDRPTVYELRSLPGLLRIELHPPASGPEVELIFETGEGCGPADENFVRREVERLTRRPVLTMRQTLERP